MIRPWKSRIVQSISFAAVLLLPNMFPFEPPVQTALAVVTASATVWLVWRLARSRVVVRADRSIEVRAVLRDYVFDGAAVDVKVEDVQTILMSGQVPCVAVATKDRLFRFWSVSDTSDDRVERWVAQIRESAGLGEEPG